MNIYFQDNFVSDDGSDRDNDDDLGDYKVVQLEIMLGDFDDSTLAIIENEIEEPINDSIVHKRKFDSSSLNVEASDDEDSIDNDPIIKEIISKKIKKL